MFLAPCDQALLLVILRFDRRPQFDPFHDGEVVWLRCWRFFGSLFQLLA